MLAMHIYCCALITIKGASLLLASRSKYGFSMFSRIRVSDLSCFMTVSLVLASAISGHNRLDSNCVAWLDVAIRASEVWTPC